MKQYLDALRFIFEHGEDRDERTWVGTRSVFGMQIKIDLSKWFPLLTTKKVFLKWIIHELLRFLTWDTNIQPLVKNGVNIWNERGFTKYLKKNNLQDTLVRYSPERDAKMTEFVEKIKIDNDFAKLYWDLGPVYGKQWRFRDTKSGKTVDQIQVVLDMLKNDTNSRRIIVSGWNAGEIQELIHDHDFAPPPCHTLFQFHVINGKLSCQLYQRSADFFLGVPFNIASYALLTMMVAQVSGLELGNFVHTFGDAHIYHNHFDQVEEQLSRDPKTLPTMKLNPEIKNLFDFTYEDFTLENYDPYPVIKAPIAV